MPEVQFITTVHVPDDLVDKDGRIIGSEDWDSTRRLSTEGHPQARYHDGVAAWTEGREPVEHYAARVLNAYPSAADRRITARTTLKPARRR